MSPCVGAHVVEVAEDHVLHGHGVDAGAAQERLDGGRPEVGGVHFGQTAATPAGGCAHRVDDVGLTHRRFPLAFNLASIMPNNWLT